MCLADKLTSDNNIFFFNTWTILCENIYYHFWIQGLRQAILNICSNTLHWWFRWTSWLPEYLNRRSFFHNSLKILLYRLPSIPAQVKPAFLPLSPSLFRWPPLRQFKRNPRKCHWTLLFRYLPLLTLHDVTIRYIHLYWLSPQRVHL